MKVVYIGHDGIGNMLHCIPLVKQCLRRGWKVHISPRGFTKSSNSLFDKWEDVTVVHNPDLKTYDRVFYGMNTNRAKDPKGKHMPFSACLKQGEAHLTCMQMGIDENDDHIAKLYSDKDFSQYKDYVVVWPGCKANATAKRWPFYDDLLRRLKNPLLVGFGKEDIRDLKKGIPSHCINMWNKTPYLPDQAALIKACKGFIGNDGGIAHLAATTGIPTYIIFGPMSVVKNRPRGEHIHILRKGVECSPCQGQTCSKYKEPICMYKFTVDDVVNQLPKDWLS